MKRWYPRRTFLAGEGALLGFAVSGSIYELVNRKHPGLLHAAALPGNSPATPLGAVLALGVVGFGIGVGGLMWVLFPEPVFGIGDGVTRHDRTKNIRAKLGWILLGACLLTPLVRALSGLLA